MAHVDTSAPSAGIPHASCWGLYIQTATPARKIRALVRKSVNPLPVLNSGFGERWVSEANRRKRVTALIRAPAIDVCQMIGELDTRAARLKWVLINGSDLFARTLRSMSA